MCVGEPLLFACMGHACAALVMCYHGVCTLNHLGLSDLPLSLAWFMGTGFYIIIIHASVLKASSSLSSKSKIMV